MPKPWEKYQQQEQALPAGPWQKFAKPVKKTAVESGFTALDTGVDQIRHALTFNMSDNIEGLGRAVADTLTGRGEGFMDSYRKGRDERNAELERKAKESPVASFAGNMVGWAANPAGRLLSPVKAAPALTNVAKGATLGGLVASGDSKADLTKGEFGDYATDVLSGAAIGSILQGGLEAGSRVLPKAVKATKVDKLYQYLKDKAASGSKWAAKKTLTSLGGVPTENIDDYLQNSARINKARPGEEIKDAIDSALEARAAARTGAESAAKESRAAMEQAFKERLAGLKQMSVPTQYADEIMGSLDSQKGVLGELADEAYQKLADKDGFVQKEHLLGFIDKIGRSQGVGKNKILVGDKATDAVNKLYTLRGRLEGLDDNISYTELKDILKQIDPDVNWNQRAGEFNPLEAKLKKEFRRGVSDVIKRDVPGYAPIMDKMSSLSDVLEQMSAKFGNRQSALTALEEATKETPRGRIARDLLAQYEKETGVNVMGKLAELKKARDTLARSAYQDLRSELVGDQLKDVTAKEARALALRQSDEAFAGITPRSTQHIVKNLGGQNPNIENRRALEALGKATDQNFLQEIRDRGVLDSFNKSNIHGSREALIGAALGRGIGGVVGGAEGYEHGGLGGLAAGAMGGAYLGSFGPRATKVILDAYIKGGPALKQVIERAGRVLSNAAAKGPEAERLAQYLVVKQFPEIKNLISVAGTSEVPEDFEPMPRPRRKDPKTEKPIYSH